MKSLLLIIAYTLFLNVNTGYSQKMNSDQRPIQPINLSEIIPGFFPDGGSSTPPSAASLWDIQFISMLDSTVSGSSGFAAVAWTGTEWYVAKWNKDSLFKLTAAGAVISGFKIPGVGAPTSGVRSITTDGTFLYMADNTTTIKKVDPTADTLVSTISLAGIGFNVRSITYSPLTNNGLGGFWISNFGSPLVEVDLTGTVLNSIPLATHTLGGIYGIAIDNLSFGGPYLWAFDQGGGVSSNLVRLNLPSGAPSFVIHNVNSDVGLATPTIGIAGGVFITDSFVPGKFTIAGIMQDTASDVLFAYELDSISQFSYDASLDTFKWQPAYTMLPDQQVSPFSFPAIVTNEGANSIPTVNYNVEVKLGVSSVFSSLGSYSNLLSGSNTLVSPPGNYTPTVIGIYKVSGVLTTLGFADQNPTNDTNSFSFSVTDTVMARDNGVINSALGIGGNLTGVLGQIFTLPNTDILTSVTFRCNAPSDGDTTRVNIYSFSGGTPGVIIGQSEYYYFAGSDTNGVWLTLEVKNLAGNPLQLTAGTYFVGIEEHYENISLATSTFNWRPNQTFITYPGQPWAPNEDFGFRRIFVLRINTGSSAVGVDELSHESTLNIYPNPADDNISVSFEDGFTAISVADAQGRVVKQENFKQKRTQENIFIGNLMAGVYFLMVSDSQSLKVQTRFVKL
ncbi:MAG: T9SS type A sorting domain-containing protein [Bacteroidetes bacterium]|nr:T9SS type A sorting domain-containing protein [Bacteroidota bacterium]